MGWIITVVALVLTVAIGLGLYCIAVGGAEEAERRSQDGWWEE